MLIWLDQAQSQKQHPNENFAREVMELFALGEGHYTEHDITEGARALTGWSLDRQAQEFVYRPFIHDNGEKTFLGRTGNLDGDDVIAQIVAQPQAAKFITGEAVELFCRPGAVGGIERGAWPRTSARTETISSRFCDALFRSEEFYSPRHRPQPGEKPGAMARRQRADAGKRIAAAAGELGNAAAVGPGFVRAAERQRLGRRRHLDHDQHAARRATTTRSRWCRASCRR